MTHPTTTERPELILSSGSIRCPDLLERISVTAQAGYAYVGLRGSDYTQAREAGYSDDDIRAQLDRFGVRCGELQSVIGWAGDREARKSARRVEEECYAAKSALGGDYMMITLTEFDDGFDNAAKAFGAVCDRSVANGLRPVIEFIPFGAVPDVRSAWELISAAGNEDAGILVDSWHHFRGSNDDSQFDAIPGDRIGAVQIADARREIRGTLFEDTQNQRLNPGEGDIDLIGLIKLLDSLGVDVPYSVEVLSTHQRSVPPLEAATASALATWSVLEAARTSS
jgi:sugar phosphate isomerase/epimerase